MSKNTPLIVDLDHTLIDTDLWYESALGALRRKPWLLPLYPFWLLRGRGYFKNQLSQHFMIDVSTLPYNQAVIDYIKKRKKNGDPIILATASNKTYAFAVAKYLTIPSALKNQKTKSQDLFAAENTNVKGQKSSYLFDDVMASNADFNLSSANKADRLVQRFGDKGFDYMGDHLRDLPVWEAANLSILVNVSEKIIDKTRHLDTLVIKTNLA